MKGLEMVALGKSTNFPIEYDFGRKGYVDPRGKIRDDIIDTMCFACGIAFYTIDRDELEFCPKCGHMEKREFTTYNDILEWSREQNWGFLKYTQMRAFAVTKGYLWLLRFAPTEMMLESRGTYQEIKALPTETDGSKKS